jgi:tRNA G18 (ribose-2'-O)-methylase SpoU
MKVPAFEYPTEVVREELNRIRHPFRVAVQRSKNPFNIGAIIRTAHSFLVREIILIGETPYYQRASMGMEKYENIVEIATNEEFVSIAHDKGWRLIVFEKDQANTSLWQADFPKECVMVFGNEETGVEPIILDAAHSVVAIPMFGLNHSYPMSVAAGIAMAEWARRFYSGGRLVVPR